MNIEDLKPAPYNPREIAAAAMSGLVSSVDAFGTIAKHTVSLVAAAQNSMRASSP